MEKIDLLYLFEFPHNRIVDDRSGIWVRSQQGGTLFRGNRIISNVRLAAAASIVIDLTNNYILKCFSNSLVGTTVNEKSVNRIMKNVVELKDCPEIKTNCRPCKAKLRILDVYQSVDEFAYAHSEEYNLFEQENISEGTKSIGIVGNVSPNKIKSDDVCPDC